jgi:Na+/H+ antiporter NhaD/arsenite permease-like protein
MEAHWLSILPFVLLLLAIAVLPFISHKWWEDNYFYISLGAGIITSVYYLFIGKGWDILHSVEEYVMFISLLAALYVISGGIFIGLRGYATPFRNVLFLLFGAVLANLIGTTGASMLLIRPFIKSNKHRITAFHIVFFIFIVSNVGGALTPIGDPPLFLGYLKGIPFFWIIGKVFVKWSITLGILLVVFYVFDRINFAKQPKDEQKLEERSHEKMEMKGIYNFGFLAIVILAVFLTKPIFLREIIMLSAAFASYKLTNNKVHERNQFNFKPIIEVAWLFIGIFVTMTPALEFLSRHAYDLNLSTPSKYYWLTGSLSAFLDNAPTYLTFLTASMGYHGLDINNLDHLYFFIESKSVYVVAISISAVFFGAMTYIGNGPNFMVKSVADHQKVKTPSFFGYMFKYSLPILLPIYALIWWLFIA